MSTFDQIKALHIQLESETYSYVENHRDAERQWPDVAVRDPHDTTPLIGGLISMVNRHHNEMSEEARTALRYRQRQRQSFIQERGREAFLAASGLIDGDDPAVAAQINRLMIRSETRKAQSMALRAAVMGGDHMADRAEGVRIGLGAPNADPTRVGSYYQVRGQAPGPGVAAGVGEDLEWTAKHFDRLKTAIGDLRRTGVGGRDFWDKAGALLTAGEQLVGDGADHMGQRMQADGDRMIRLTEAFHQRFDDFATAAGQLDQAVRQDGSLAYHERQVLQADARQTYLQANPDAGPMMLDMANKMEFGRKTLNGHGAMRIWSRHPGEVGDHLPEMDQEIGRAIDRAHERSLVTAFPPALDSGGQTPAPMPQSAPAPLKRG